MNWRVKGMIQKMLGYVPAGEDIHHWLQMRGGGLANFARECDVRVDDWRLMAGHLGAVNVPIAGSRFIEMGTGWYPTLPFALFLAGAKQVITIDLNRHVRPELVVALGDRLGEHIALIADKGKRPAAEVGKAHEALRDALHRGASIEDATGGAVEYRAPGDASDTGLPDGSIDVFFSNSVLEHVPADVIAACFAEARRVLRPGGITFQSVNCGDHYAYVDKRIHQLNYLQYSDAAWEKWNNRFLYQNRLRAIDFVRMAKDAGFAIELDTSRASAERLRQLDTLRVAREFDKYTREQLAMTSVDFVGRKA
jgi:SAM-dependent methyltransferase